MQHCQRQHQAPDIGARRNRRDNRRPSQERKDRHPPDAGQDRQHRNDEQHMTYSVIDGRPLDDEKSERQENGRTYDEYPPCACERQRDDR